jgi:hypothetical protein
VEQQGRHIPAAGAETTPGEDVITSKTAVPVQGPAAEDGCGANTGPSPFCDHKSQVHTCGEDRSEGRGGKQARDPTVGKVVAPPGDDARHRV